MENITIRKKVVIYTTDTCKYCVRAKQVFNVLGWLYEERDVLESNVVFKTVPQIYFDDEHIGGYSDLLAYIAEKVLD